MPHQLNRLAKLVYEISKLTGKDNALQNIDEAKELLRYYRFGYFETTRDIIDFKTVIRRDIKYRHALKKLN